MLLKHCKLDFSSRTRWFYNGAGSASSLHQCKNLDPPNWDDTWPGWLDFFCQYQIHRSVGPVSGMWPAWSPWFCPCDSSAWLALWIVTKAYVKLSKRNQAMNFMSYFCVYLTCKMVETDKKNSGQRKSLFLWSCDEGDACCCNLECITGPSPMVWASPAPVWGANAQKLALMPTGGWEIISTAPNIAP